MADRSTILSAQALSIGYHRQKGNRVLAEQLQLSLQTGELTCLLGVNGIGKSTLMRTLAGMHPPLAGTVLLEHANIRQMQPGALAQKVSIVLTDPVTVGNLSVYQLVAMGRYPYTGWLGRMQEEDHQKVQWAIQTTGITPLIHRHLHHLSDGERQKVMIARALAQDTPLIFLDEPTAHLDLPNRMSIVSLLREMVKETRKAILMTMHDVDLALQCADRLWLMQDQSIVAGVPEDLVLQGAIQQVFQHESMGFDITSGNFRLRHQEKLSLCLQGEGEAFLWTRRALEREGYTVNNTEKGTPGIVIPPGKPTWHISDGPHTGICYSIEELLQQLRIITSNPDKP